jgi:hypothetical protein
MPTFVPSQHSDVYGDWRDYAPEILGGRPAEEASSGKSFMEAMGGKGVSEYVVVSDGAGSFGIHKDGTITVIGGYPNVGSKFKVGTSTGDQVLKNLSAVAGNQLKMEAVLGKPAVSKSLSSPTAKTTSGAPATMEDVVEGDVKVPLTQQPWFMPVVIGLGAAAVIGGIIFWPKK